MRVKPTQKMHAALMLDLKKSGCPKHVAKECIKGGEFNHTREGLTFHQPDSGYARQMEWQTVGHDPVLI